MKIKLDAAPDDELLAARELLRAFDMHTPIDAVPKEVWDQLKAFYEKYGPANHEEGP